MSWLIRKWQEYKCVLQDQGQTELDEFEIYIEWANKKIEHDLKEVIEEIEKKKNN